MLFLSADAAAATSAMVSASAPSVYSVQALSLLAEVNTQLTCHPLWKLLPSWFFAKVVHSQVPVSSSVSLGLELHHGVLLLGSTFTTKFLLVTCFRRFLLSCDPVLLGSGISPGHGLSKRWERESGAIGLSPALLRFSLLTQSQVMLCPPRIPPKCRKIGDGRASSGLHWTVSDLDPFYFTPPFSAYNAPSFRAGAQLLSSLSGYAYTKRAWKKEVLELFLDPAFFQMDTSCVQ